MNWFTSIFSRENKTSQITNDETGNSTSNESVEIPNLTQDLFVDNNPPSPEAPDQAQQIKISTFLDRDFHRKGFEDGYSWHSKEMLDNQIKSTKAEFRYFLDQKIDELHQTILKITDQKISAAGLSDTMTQQLQLRIDLLDVNIQRLEREKISSFDEEGLIMKAIHQYRDGFIKGMETYQEEKFFAGSTGLFI